MEATQDSKPGRARTPDNQGSRTYVEMEHARLTAGFAQAIAVLEDTQAVYLLGAGDPENTAEQRYMGIHAAEVLAEAVYILESAQSLPRGA